MKALKFLDYFIIVINSSMNVKKQLRIWQIAKIWSVQAEIHECEDFNINQM